MEQLARVKMLAHHHSNVPGDICGFPPDEAARLVAMQAAAYHGPQLAAFAEAAEPLAEAPQAAAGWLEDSGEDSPAASALVKPAALPAKWKEAAPKPTK